MINTKTERERQQENVKRKVGRERQKEKGRKRKVERERQKEKGRKRETERKCEERRWENVFAKNVIQSARNK